MDAEQEIPERLSMTVCKIAGPLQRAPILMWITPEEVGIRMGLAKFIEAIASEVGSPAMIMTQAQLLARLQAASDRVVLSMKQETTGA